MLIMSYCVNQVIIENALFSYFIRAFVPPAGVFGVNITIPP